MKQFILFSLLASFIPLTMLAQDDLYFTPSRTKTQKQVDSRNYYSGINKSDDEYNRRYRQNSYQMMGQDSLRNDLMQLRADGRYNDSLSEDPEVRKYERYYDADEDDFAYSRRMGRFEGFWGWYDPWFIGSPYYVSRWGYYDPWYYDWYDPWYYGYGRRGYYGYRGYYDWTSPWGYNRYSAWGWGYPYYYDSWLGIYPYYGGYYYSRNYLPNGHTGTANHWSSSYNADRTYTRGNFSGYRGNTSGSRPARGYAERDTRRNGSYSNSFSGTRQNYNSDTRQNSYNRGFGSNSYNNTRSTDSYNSRFGGSRTETRSSNYQPSYDSNRSNTTHSFGSGSSGSSRSFSSGGSFSGSRSSGGGGGGSFGGSRSSGGGGGFSGRR